MTALLERKDELMDIARLILFMKQDIKLAKVGESPDFIIEVNNEQIGIEHARVYNKLIVAIISILGKICKKVQRDLM